MDETSECSCSDPSCSQHIENVRGSSGTIFGDRSSEFLGDINKFVVKYSEMYQSRMFMTRIALKPTMVIADNALVGQFLNNCMDNFYNGLKDQYSELFGHNIMFADPEEAMALRNLFLPLFGKSALANYQPELERQLSYWSSHLPINQPVNMYEQFKQFSLSYNLAVFLGVRVEDDPDLFRDLCSLSTTHWHGVMSLPMHLRIPMFGRGGYSKAMEARQKLIHIIKEIVSQNKKPEFLEQLCESVGDNMEEESLHNHLLLFCCSLIPKASASILSMVMEAGGQWMEEWRRGGQKEEELEAVVLETIRMFPPFVGGLRIAKSDTKVGRYCVSGGTAVYYSFLAAHRDPAVFQNPDQFLPERWRLGGCNHQDKNRLYGFGSGPHGCIGRTFTWTMMMECIKHLVKHFRFDPPSLFPPEVKHLPVLRPKQPHLFILTRTE